MLVIVFQEANKMVQDANVKRMNTEKLLKEANSQVRKKCESFDKMRQCKCWDFDRVVILSATFTLCETIHSHLSLSKQKGSQ